MALTDANSGHITLGEYDYTCRLTRSRWAWEFLRRNPDFREAALTTDQSRISEKPACHGVRLLRPDSDQSEAEKFGLAFFPDIDANGHDANTFWNPAIYARTLTVQVTPRHPGEHDEIFKRCVATCEVVHLTDRVGRESLLVRGNGHVLQVACSGLSLLSVEPVKMKLIIEDVTTLDDTLRLISRAQRVLGNEENPEEPEWTRSSLAWRNALIALDAHEAGLTYFETATIIYGSDRANEAWQSASRAMKDEMRRALARGRELRDGGYRDLLAAQT
ncbi:DNA -binding domain-containing protein [Hyphomonas sp.]|uniref:DNA -binding domain-containing protein n=1 Tax=Hyphomonas sp. TaxID=87 RepID=UPI003F6E57D4